MVLPGFINGHHHIGLTPVQHGSPHQSLQQPLGEDEIERRPLSKRLMPHVRLFYAGYFDPEAHMPYYRGVEGDDQFSHALHIPSSVADMWHLSS
jgi:hypothetical protein